jgi:hypothetical protein
MASAFTQPIRNPLRPRVSGARLAARRRHAPAPSELDLLSEFLRHDSVSSLAGAIAGRLGGRIRASDLIAGADLDADRGAAVDGGSRQSVNGRANTRG